MLSKLENHQAAFTYLSSLSNIRHCTRWKLCSDQVDVFLHPGLLLRLNRSESLVLVSGHFIHSNIGHDLLMGLDLILLSLDEEQ